ncbi:MAG: DUF2812 domain-containing protein [Firmicutes bacterium]|nr:DUF2812 domain-containing protein [Bacillota bacterium]
MSKPKYTKRYRFLRTWQIAENEAWFTAMSAQGLHLHSIGGFFATFLCGEPTEYIYSIEPLDKEVENEEKLAIYEDAGWELVAEMEELQVFRTPVQSNVKPIHTDRSIYLELLQQRKKALFKSTLLGLLAGLIYIAYSLYRWPILATFLGFLFLLPYFFVFPNLFKMILDYYYLYSYVKQGQLHEQNKSDYQQAIRKRKLTQGAILLIELLCLVSIIHVAYQAKATKPLSMAPAYVLTLEEIYGDENLVVPAEYENKNIFSSAQSLRYVWTDYANYARKDGRFVVIYGNVYLAKNVGTARQMVKALVVHWKKPRTVFNNIVEYTSRPQNPGFDELYLSDNYTSGMGIIIARQGNYVYDISYIRDGKLVLEALYHKAAQLR